MKPANLYLMNVLLWTNKIKLVFWLFYILQYILYSFWVHRDCKIELNFILSYHWHKHVEITFSHKYLKSQLKSLIKLLKPHLYMRLHLEFFIFKNACSYLVLLVNSSPLCKWNELFKNCPKVYLCCFASILFMRMA